MRIDKFLKVARLIKRRSIANQACSVGAILLNGKKAKPGSKVKVGDVVSVELGASKREYEILMIAETVTKDQALEMYRQL